MIIKAEKAMTQTVIDFFPCRSQSACHPGSTLLPAHMLEDLTAFCSAFSNPEHTVSIPWSERAVVAFSGMAEFCLYNTETILKYMAKYSNKSSWEM